MTELDTLSDRGNIYFSNRGTSVSKKKLLHLLLFALNYIFEFSNLNIRKHNLMQKVLNLEIFFYLHWRSSLKNKYLQDLKKYLIV